MVKVFVYGTLKNGNREKTYIKGDLYNLGSFPAIDLSGNNLIEVEIAEIDDSLLVFWDTYEGYNPGSHNNLYERVEVTSTNGIRGFIYEFANKSRLKQYPKISADKSNICVWEGRNNIMSYITEVL